MIIDKGFEIHTSNCSKCTTWIIENVKLNKNKTRTLFDIYISNKKCNKSVEIQEVLYCVSSIA